MKILLSYTLIKFYFDNGVYDIDKVVECVKNKLITEEEFHYITGYNYYGVTKARKE